MFWGIFEIGWLGGTRRLFRRFLAGNSQLKLLLGLCGPVELFVDGGIFGIECDVCCG